MKPLGTITLFFPYVDDETRGILNSIMVEANDFDEFSELLCTKVLTTDTPTLTQYLNFYYMMMLYKQSKLNEIASANKIPPIAKPLFLLTRFAEGVDVSWDEMIQLLADATEVAPNEWFVCHLYLTWRYIIAITSIFPPSKYNLHPYESIIADVKENRDLEYISIYLLLIETQGFAIAYEISKAIPPAEHALMLARKYDDQLLEAQIEYLLASCIKHTDVRRAIDYAHHARGIFNKLGNKNGLSLIQNLLGHIMGIRGEYDAAIDHHKESRKIAKSLSIPTIMVDGILAMYYNLADKAVEALDMVNPFLTSYEMPPLYLSNLLMQKTWALIILNRNEDARVEFDKFRELTLKSGDTELLVRLELVEGLLDKCENKIESAAAIFEKLLISFKEDPLPIFENICLLNLVDIEIRKHNPEFIDSNAVSSGIWMKTLEERISKFDWPGVAAQSMILRAKFREKQGRHDEVRQLLQQVIRASESPSMMYLRTLIAKEFPKIAPI